MSTDTILDSRMFDNVHAELERARERRKQLRAENHLRPRCAACGNDMLVFSPHDVLTHEGLQNCSLNKYYEPGDILCYWCLRGEEPDRLDEVAYPADFNSEDE